MQTVFDYCSGNCLEVRGSAQGPYYSNFSPTGRERGAGVNFKRKSEVCRVCNHQGTNNCIAVRQQKRKEELLKKGPRILKKGPKLPVLVEFRSQRKRKKKA